MEDPGFEDPYQILGVQRGASDQAIAAAYKRLARQHHPDLAGESATLRMARINAAFDLIRTAPRRVEYDEVGPRRAGRSAPDMSNRGDRDRFRWKPERDGTGGAGPPPGRPSGSVIGFGRHIGWSIGEIARVDPGYLHWLAERREGRPYLDEIDAVLRRTGYLESTDQRANGRGRRSDQSRGSSSSGFRR